VSCIQSGQGADREGDMCRLTGMQIAREARVDECWPCRQASLAWSSRSMPSSCHRVSEDWGSGSQGSDLVAAVAAWRRSLSSSHSEGSFFTRAGSPEVLIAIA